MFGSSDWIMFFIKSGGFPLIAFNKVGAPELMEVDWKYQLREEKGWCKFLTLKEVVHVRF